MYAISFYHDVRLVLHRDFTFLQYDLSVLIPSGTSPRRYGALVLVSVSVSGFWIFLRAPIRFLSSIDGVDGVAKLATGIPLAGIGQKSRFRLAGKVFNDEIRLKKINREPRMKI